MMKFFTRMIAYMATVLALCTVLFNFVGTWFGEQGSMLQFAHDMMCEKRRFDALEYRSEAVHHALANKERFITELHEGRLCLWEVIVQFQRVNKELIESLTREDMYQDLIAAYVLPPTDPEGVGRQILLRFRVDVTIWPSEKTERRLADLEREFRELFGKASLSDSSADTELMGQEVGWKRGPRCELR